MLEIALCLNLASEYTKFVFVKVNSPQDMLPVKITFLFQFNDILLLL